MPRLGSCQSPKKFEIGFHGLAASILPAALPEAEARPAWVQGAGSGCRVRVQGQGAGCRVRVQGAGSGCRVRVVPLEVDSIHVGTHLPNVHVPRDFRVQALPPLFESSVLE